VDFGPDFRDFMSDLKGFGSIFRDSTSDFKVFKPDFRDFWSVFTNDTDFRDFILYFRTFGHRSSEVVGSSTHNVSD